MEPIAGPEGQEEPEAAPEESAGAAVDPDGTVVVAVRRVPGHLDPMGDLEAWGHRVADDLVFQGLVRRRGDRAPWAEPDLADHCEVDAADAPRMVWCHLRPAARFHDGTAVTPEDVLYTFEWWLDSRRESTRQHHGLEALREVEVVHGPPGGSEDQRDPNRWIKLTFERPQPLALEKLAAVKVVPRDAHRGRANRFRKAPVGSGPMRVVSLSADRLVLERAASRGTDRPVSSGRIVIRAVPDGAQALSLLRRGEVHVLAELAPVHIPAELGQPGMAPRFRAFVATPPRYDLVLYNLRRGVWSGPRMRSALDRALPRATVAHELHGGQALPAAAPVDLFEPRELDMDALAGIRDGERGRGLPVSPDVVDDANGRREAGAVLDGLQWKLTRDVRQRPTGTLRITLLWDGSTGGSPVAAAIRDAWRDVGIIVPYATASWSYVRRGPMANGEFEVALARLGTASDEDLFRYFHGSGPLNVTGVSDRELDAALESYRAAATRADRDLAKQAVATRIAELKPVSVVHAPVTIRLVSRRVVGVSFVDDLPRLDTLAVLSGPDPWLTGQ